MGKAYHFYETSTRHILGNGHNTSFWSQDWGLGILETEYPNLFSHAVSNFESVANILTSAPLETLFRSTLTTQAAQELAQLQQQLLTISLSEEHDIVQWKWSSSGEYTVNSAYKALKYGPKITNKVSQIWRIKAPPRMNVFGWLMCMNKILTIDNLVIRSWHMVNMCIMCRQNAETVHHLFDECPFTMVLYSQTVQEWGMLRRWSPSEIIKCNTVKGTQRSTILITQFVIWRERCSRIFTDMVKNIDQLRESVKNQEQYTLRIEDHCYHPTASKKQRETIKTETQE